MIWELNSNTDYIENNSEDCLSENLSRFSTVEIQNLKTRVNFYLAHYLIVSRKTRTESSETRLGYLRKLNAVLEGEMNQRIKKVHI